MEPKFMVGDEVRRTKSTWDGMKIGDIGTVTDVRGSGNVKLKEYSRRGDHNRNNLELVIETTKKEIKDMKKSITNVYEKTQDALVVEKYLGSCIVDDFTSELILRNNKVAYLTEAKRLEKEAEKKN